MTKLKTDFNPSCSLHEVDFCAILNVSHVSDQTKLNKLENGRHSVIEDRTMKKIYNAEKPMCRHFCCCCQKSFKNYLVILLIVISEMYYANTLVTIFNEVPETVVAIAEACARTGVI